MMRSLCILALALATSAVAQVEKVAMRTTGISCGVCAAVSELNFKRIPGVDKVKISLSQEAIMITYKPGAAFSTQQILDVLKPLDVGVTQLQIGARGRIQQESAQRFFIAGKDRFLIEGHSSSAAPLNSPIRIEAVLKDRTGPMEINILNWAPASP
jgi:copper chaperone CopZ